MPEAAVHVLRKVINVVFALAKSDRKHELPLRRGVEPECRGLQGRYLADVHKVDKPPAVYGVAGQPVRVPSHYALGRALLHLGYHVVEQLAARLLGGFAFNELADYGQTVLLGVVPQFSELRLYGQDLPVRLIGGLASV
ncbi:MAG: hypothetical protein A2270_02985 [Elusimicrobia bacterium RIFOXYA12_FULL_51_18]|nr:MAG: hypothetical protein A2270_02985 [Elusimicrobia bacterium RIFOXYA12_FULL_51_18]OGS28387.1 MAG: hypothetical protein A2218_06905 [Elusimicrobia bacterium RIFOXYA2_FULL_53_38]